MTRSCRALGLLAAALLAAARVCAFSDADYLRQYILRDNDPFAAMNFLADGPRQDALKVSEPDLFREVFQRAAELKDLKGVVSGASDARSIRLGLLRRTGCTFCLDANALTSWVKEYMPERGPAELRELDSALWSWGTLTEEQKAWLAQEKQDAPWAKMAFLDRHEQMRRWALGERDVLLKLNPGDEKGVADFRSRAGQIQEALGYDEMTQAWRRWELAKQASTSMALARARAAAGVDARQRALLAEAAGAADPPARLSALSQFFENLGERPRELLEAAPPRPDQRFDGESRRVVCDLLKTSLLKETGGTFAGKDLEAFYSRVPLEVRFSMTDMSAFGWYDDGGNTLFFNERYVEQYVKSRGASVEELKRDPALLRDLARTLIGTFVHEAQHHRQDVWARDNKQPRLYHQGDEVEAFQVQALFLLEKMKNDPKFRAFAEAEGERSDVLKTGLERARRMEEEGPDYFAWTVPNSHYPEVLSNEGHAWCRIVWHNRVIGVLNAELSRRESLREAERGKLDLAPLLKENYESEEEFKADVLVCGSGSLREWLAKARETMGEAAQHYALLRRRQEAEARITMERFKKIQAEEGTLAKARAPPPILTVPGAP